MIVLLALMAAAADPLSGCRADLARDPAATLATLEGKRDNGQLAPTDRECLGLAYVDADRLDAATLTFESAAQAAEVDGDLAAPGLWTQAGNSALAMGDAGRARRSLSRALSFKSLDGQLRGEVNLDRARAEVQAGDPVAARTDLDEALRLVAADPMAWLLSATLARRQGDGTRAQADVAKAVELAPGDPAVALEAGNVAASVGAADAARVAWQHAVEADPDGGAGKSARQALAALDGGASPPAEVHR